MNIEKDDFRTGDIILLSGRKSIFSKIVEWATYSTYSHIGIVLKDPVQIDPSLRGIYLWESGMEPVPDSVDHVKKFGVQIVPLEQKIERYDGTVVYRKLGWEKSNIKRNKMCASIYNSVKDKPYDTSPWDFLEADLQKNLGNPRNEKAFFCSAFVSYVYTKLGLFPQNTEWTLFQPESFSSSKLVYMEDGAFLGNEYILKH